MPTFDDHDSDDHGLAARLGLQNVRALIGKADAPIAVGRFELHKPLGRGAMGEVFAAWDPELERNVAIKVIAAAASPLAAERFVREGRALARLSHPNIVQVYEVGPYDDSMFIAMELVEGQTLADWVLDAQTNRRRPWREILHAYRDAGRGLAAAHDAGLVHRDFKPGNAMMGDDGRARVLDFGLARAATELPDTETSGTSRAQPSSASHDSLRRVTETGLAPGTPAYMAPEQHRREPATAASDQFSFCVALWEGLHGVRPFAGSTTMAIYEAIRSGRVVAIPGAARLPRRIVRALRRGLSYDPTDRFPSMHALLSALDVDRRRRLGVASVGLVGLGLGAGLVLQSQRSAEVPAPCDVLRAEADGSIPGTWDDARRAEIEAAFLATKAPFAAQSWNAVASSLDDWTGAFELARLDACEAHHVRAEQSAELFDLRMACLDRQVLELDALTDELAAADADVVEEAVSAMRGLPAIASCDDASELRRDRPRPTPQQAPQVERVRQRLARANAKLMTGRYDEGLATAHEATALAEATGFRPSVSEALYLRGALRLRADQLESGVADLERAAYDAARDADDDLAARAWEHLASHAFVRLGNVDRGRQWLLQAEVAHEREGRLHDEDVELRLLEISGNLDRVAGNRDAAIDALSRVVDGRRRRAQQHPGAVSDFALSDALLNLAAVRQDRAEYEPALALHLEALEITTRLLGPSHPDTAMVELDVGTALQALGLHEQAREHHARALRVWEDGRTEPSRWAGNVHTALVDIAFREGRVDRAIDHARKAQAIYEATLPDDHPDLASAYNTLGVAYFGARELEASVRAYRRALDGYERHHGPDHLEVAGPASNLGESLVALGRFAEALPYFERAEQIFAAQLGDDVPQLAYPLKGRGLALLGSGRTTHAHDVLQRAWALASPHDPLERGEIAVGLALSVAERDPDEAGRWAATARELLAEEAGDARLHGLLEALGERGQRFDAL